MTSKSLLQKYDKWIFDAFPLSPEALGIYRIIYSSYVLFVSGIPDWRCVGKLPNIIYSPSPYSFGALFPGFPNYYILVSLSLIVCAFFIMLLFGYKTKLVSLLITPLYIIGNSFQYAGHKINHDDLLMLLVPLVMSFSNWGSRFSIDSIQGTKSKLINTWPVSLMALIIGFAFFSAGMPKLFSGWLDTSTHVVKGVLYATYYTKEEQKFLAHFLLSIQNDLFWEVIDYLTVIFEVGFLIAVFIPTLFRLFVSLAIFFHLAILLALNIDFADNLSVYILFINWSAFLNFLEKIEVDRFLIKFIKIRNMIVVSIPLLLYYLTMGSSPLKYLFGNYQLHCSIVLLSMGTLFAIVNVIVSLRQNSN